MIIDFHTHIWEKDWLSDGFWKGLTSVVSQAIPSMDIEEVKKNVMPGFWHAPVEDLIAEMDEAKIDKAVILPLDFGLRIGEAKISIEEQNERYAKMAEQYPDRILPFVGVDPRRAFAIELFKRGIEEWGMKGLKLHPTSGFYPNDPVCYPFYERCQEFGVPVLIHTGTELSPLQSKFARPIYLDDVAADFPDLKLIAAHFGFGWWEEAMSVAMVKPNVYLDTAAWGYYSMRNPLYFYQALRTICDMVGSDKVLFGSDWPMTPRLLLSESQWIERLRNPPEEVKTMGIKFNENEINSILGENAAKILKV